MTFEELQKQIDRLPVSERKETPQTYIDGSFKRLVGIDLDPLYGPILVFSNHGQRSDQSRPLPPTS